MRLSPREFAALTRAQRRSKRVQGAGAGDQMRLPGVDPRRRKTTLTVDELRRLQPERDIRAEVIGALRMHPAVAWVARAEPYSGYVLPESKRRAFAAALGRQASWRPEAVLALLASLLAWREFGLPGQSDVVGQLRIGHLLAIEVKRPGEKPDPHQQVFLDCVTRANGCAGVARSSAEAIERITAFAATHTMGER